MREETKRKLLNIGKKINLFVESEWWILLNVVLTFVGWVSGGWFVMLPILVVANVLPLFFFKETKHLLVFLMTFTLIISDNRHHLDDFAWMLSFVALLFAGIIFSLIRFKRDFSLLHPKRVKGFHASLASLIIPFAFAGVTKPAENPVARIAVLALIILIAAGYTFFVLTITDEKERKGLAAKSCSAWACASSRNSFTTISQTSTPGTNLKPRLCTRTSTSVGQVRTMSRRRSLWLFLRRSTSA